ncbi:MAG: hypothetical protein K2X66_04805 [Cyanobacteria bacterium]|nr:hypothetical protein [Cyanobacteriota bacterium]
MKDSGDKPDVINISQFIGQSSADTQKVQQLIKDLTAQGVKVVVAAGNNGPNQKNALAPAEADTVSNGTNQSGPGNVTGSGRTTSFAAANRTAELLKGLK